MAKMTVITTTQKLRSPDYLLAKVPGKISQKCWIQKLKMKKKKSC